MKILIFIHGGDSFAQEKDYQEFLGSTFALRQSEPWEDNIKPDWKLPIARAWTNQGGIFYYPTMPNKQNAKYTDWKVVFETILAKISPEDEITLMGGSLGGCFLLKYFSEQNPLVFSLFRQIKAVHLIAACISEGNFTPPTQYTILQSLGNHIHIWHAEDDLVVPFETALQLGEILPEAQTHFFGPERGYGHFHSIASIPELENILTK